MAKINHNNVYDTIDRVIENAKLQRSIHLYAEGSFLTGSHLVIRGKQLAHFATTGYLGLEQDLRLKNAAAEAVMKFGTQFPLSKTYISHPLYEELEEKMENIFLEPVIIAKNSTLAHMAVIPQAIGDLDAVILDHQVHWSVQNACQILKTRGIPVYLIRHNNMEQLEDYIVKLKNKHSKIWYMADGIYSMYGDHAPIKILKELVQHYPQLHLYFDDVHGMSWIGDRGAGFIKTHWPQLPNNMILISTLSKTFGASGASILCGDRKLFTQIKNFGGPLTFSAQLEPSAVAAAIASANIHLTPEITLLQESLRNKLLLFKQLMLGLQLPLISHSDTPVFYLGTSLPETAYNLVNRLYQEGYFVNPGIYPAVPLKNAGLRITISNHNDVATINGLAQALALHFNEALIETKNTYGTIYKSFGMAVKAATTIETNVMNEVFIYDSIKEIDKSLWNKHLGIGNALDYDGMLFVETYFSTLPKDNHNYMEFKYYMIKDLSGEVLALTHTSLALWKEDMLATEGISEKIEVIRLKDPLFLVHKALSTGSTFTEGTHVYINTTCVNHAQVKLQVLSLLETEFNKHQATKLVFRDFTKNNSFGDQMVDRGYVTVDMPDTAIFDTLPFTEFEELLSKRSKRHFKKEILPYCHLYKFSTTTTLAAEELQKAYELYVLVKDKNLAINNFTYDYSLFEHMNNDPHWTFLLAKDAVDNRLVGVVFCFINQTNNSFNPVLIGMEDSDTHRLQLYRQLLFETIIYANTNQYTTSYFGVSATFEKKKLGATIVQKEAYVHLKDQYVTDVLENFK